MLPKLMHYALLMMSEGYSRKTAIRYWATAQKTHSDMDSKNFDFYFDKIVPLIGPLQGVRLLDYGAGRGELAQLFRRAGASPTATDIALHFVQKMREEGIDAYLPDALPNESRFDVILVNNAFFYVHPKGRKALLQRFRGMLPKGGRLLITDTPDYAKRRLSAGDRGLGLARRLILTFFPVYQPEMAGFFIDFGRLGRLALESGFSSFRILDSWSPYRSHLVLEV